MTVISTPGVALCDGVSLRARASTAAALRTTLAAGTAVTFGGTVTGGAWRSSCTGSPAAGSTWYRVSRINGKAVSSHYGERYLYAATGLFKSASTTLAVACDGVVLRTGASITARQAASLKRGSTVTISATVRSAGWTASCIGPAVSANTWYRITAVDGQPVTSLYGLSSLYAATALFTTKPTAEGSKTPPPVTIATPPPTPSPRPIPSPSPSPTSAPSATPSATPVPSATPGRAATIVAACNATLYATASQSGAATTVVASGTSMTVAETVQGQTWTGSCADAAAQGTTWYGISAIGGTPVSSLYGVAQLYVIAGALQPAATPPPSASPPLATIVGVDVSHLEGTIDWQQVAHAGNTFAYIKASEGTAYVDPTYATNRANAEAAGLRVGAFHYAQPDAAPGNAAANADHFIDTAGLRSGELLPVLDVELTNGLSAGQLQAWVGAFLDRVYQRTGLRAMIYTSPNFWRDHVGGTTSFATNGSGLWVAHWTDAASPSVPAANWAGYGWTVWQYSDHATVPGINRPTDVDRYNGADLGRILIP